MNPIKIRIHEAKRHAGSNITTTAEEKKGRNDGDEDEDDGDEDDGDDDDDGGDDDGDDGTDHEQSNVETAPRSVSDTSIEVMDNEALLRTTSLTLARTLWEIDQNYKHLVDSLVD